MPARKRTASEVLLPTRAPKQARMTLDRSATQPGVHSGPSNVDGLLARWIALTKETLKYLLGLNEDEQGTRPSAIREPLSRPSTPAARPANPSPPSDYSLPSRASIPQFLFEPSTHSAPPPPTAKSAASTRTRTSAYCTPGPSSLCAAVTSPQEQLRVAMAKVRSQNQLKNGVQRRYQRKDHIHARLHKARVRDELERKLYELQRARGYSSNFDDFRGLLAYQKRLQDLERQESLSLGSASEKHRDRSTTPSILNPADDEFLKLALQKAQKTFESPKPPKPFVPTIEQLRLSTRARDEEIELRLHPKRPSLPERLPDEAQAEVNAILRRTGVVSKCIKEQVTDQDLRRLGPSQWLNDEIINFYGQLIMNRALEAEAGKENGATDALRVHYFSTFFWLKLKAGYEKGRLAKWTKKIDIFSKDVILIPVNHNNAHWTAAAINFRRKRMEAYDSMGQSRAEVFRALRMYVDEEHKNKKKKPFDFASWEDYIPEDVPQQENGFDCGVFACQFLETLSRGDEYFNFSQRDMPYLRQRMIWEIGRARLGVAL